MNSTRTKTYIWITFQKEGIHQYPAALEDPKLKEVSFLGNPHRHMFYFKVFISVTHSDRELEFILEKRKIESWYDSNLLLLENKSCEMMAEELLAKLIEQYGCERNYKIEVSEDRENGCILEY